MRERALGTIGLGTIGLAAAALAWLSIGLTHALALGEQPVQALWWGGLWWAAWVGYAAAYMAVTLAEARSPRCWASAAPPGAVLFIVAVLVPLGLVTVWLSPIPGLAGIAVVLTAGTLAEYLPPRWALAAILGQTLAMLLPELVSGEVWRAPWALVTAMAFLGFQLFVFVMVIALRRAEQARLASEAAQAALRAAQAQLAEASRAEERLRIARDLHDAIGHQLTALSLNLQIAVRLSSRESRDQLEQCQRVAADLLDDVRRVVGQLREAPVEDHAGEAASGPWLRRELAVLASGLPRPALLLDVDQDLPELPAGLADVVRRCVQEIVTNAARHGDARHLWVAVEELDGVVSVSAHDDGGAPAGTLDGAPAGTGRGGRTVDAGGESGASGDMRIGPVVPGNGLTGMAERCAAHGGTVAWRRLPGGGFSVQASLPLVPPAPAPDATGTAAQPARRRMPS